MKSMSLARLLAASTFAALVASLAVCRGRDGLA